MIIAKTLFILFVLAVIFGFVYILYVHSKYENIILLDVQVGDVIPSEKSYYSESSGDVFTVVDMCDVMMTITYRDCYDRTRTCYWSEFICMVGCKNLCEKYNKDYYKIDDFIMQS